MQVDRQRIPRRLTAAGAVAAIGGAVVLLLLLLASSGDSPPALSADPAGRMPTTAAEPPAEVRWSRTDVFVGADPLSSGWLVIGGDRAHFVATGFAGDGRAAVSALDAASGDELWRYPMHDTAFLQAAQSGVLVASEHIGQIVGLDDATGRRLWDIDLPAGYGAVRSAVVGAQAILVAGAHMEDDTSAPLVLAIDVPTGDILWQRELLEDTDPQWIEPIVLGTTVVVQSTPDNPTVDAGNTVHALAVRDGTLRWQRDLGGGPGFAAMPALTARDLVIVSGPDGGTLALDQVTGAEVWRDERGVLAGFDGGPLFVGGDRPYELQPLDASTGRPHPTAARLSVGVQRLGAGLSGVTDGEVTAAASTRRVVAFDPQGHAVVRHELGALPAQLVLTGDGDLLIADQSGTLTALALPRAWDRAHGK